MFQAPAVQPCKVVVHATKAVNLKKRHDTQTIDAYLMMQLREEPESIKRTRAINNDLNPIWNQKLEFHSKDKNTDRLVINMYNQINNNEKLMNEIELPINQWQIGTHIDYQEEISLQKKKAGRLFLGIDVLNEDEPANTPIVEPAKVPETETETYTETEPLSTETETEQEQESEPEPEPEPETETETETEPISTQSRGIHLEDPSCEYCDFTWGPDDSQYSTDFTGFTYNSSSLSALRSTERFHRHHHINRKAVAEPLQPIVTEEEPSVKHDPDHPCDDPGCQQCHFKWGDLDSRYSTDFTGFTENSKSLSALHSTDENFHHDHIQDPNSILAPETQPAKETEKLNETKETNQTLAHDHDHPCDDSGCQQCHFSWDNLDSRYSTDFTGFTDNSQTLSALHSTDEDFHHDHKQDPNSILAPENQSGDIFNDNHIQDVN